MSEHSRVLGEQAAACGFEPHVWTAAGAVSVPPAHVHATLGSFRPADLARTGALLDAFPAPRRVVVQWVPHGYGRRGMNVRFARWVAARAAAGDRIDVIVHEPFVDFFGASWAQPAQAVIQRYMTRIVLRAARHVWMSIPGWEPRLTSVLRADAAAPRVLAVPGTIPVDRDARAIANVRARLIAPGQHLVAYFGTGGRYADDALARTLQTLLPRRPDVIVVCLGRGSGDVASRVRRTIAGIGAVHATGALELSALSHHLQACDVLLQPYVDGVSGRRTTTISALEHAVPVATTFGVLSEPYWRTTDAVETVPAEHPERLAGAVERLLEPARNSLARSSALTLYASRFEPRIALEPLFAD